MKKYFIFILFLSIIFIIHFCIKSICNTYKSISRTFKTPKITLYYETKLILYIMMNFNRLKDINDMELKITLYYYVI